VGVVGHGDRVGPEEASTTVHDPQQHDLLLPLCFGSVPVVWTALAMLRPHHRILSVQVQVLVVKVQVQGVQMQVQVVQVLAQDQVLSQRQVQVQVQVQVQGQVQVNIQIKVKVKLQVQVHVGVDLLNTFPSLVTQNSSLTNKLPYHALVLVQCAKVACMR